MNATKRGGARRRNGGRRRAGFTLVELLAVIAIVAVLAALAWVGLARVRQGAQSTQSLANLRQVGVAIGAYTADHGYITPGSQGSWVFWYDAISPYLAQRTSAGSRDGTSPVLDSPAKAIPTAGPRCAFIANVTIMRDLANPANVAGRPVRLAQIARPSQALLVMDGEQNADGLVQHVNYQMPGITDTNPANGEQSIGVLDNEDRGRARIRFRHRGERFAHCLFADGHVEEIENGKILKKHLQIGY